MGYYVHLSVVMPCDDNDAVAAIAARHLSALGGDEPMAVVEQRVEGPECRMYLRDLSTRTGPNPGQKGGLSLWGIVGNYTKVKSFVAALEPFWIEVLMSDEDGTPLDFEHILVFYEAEGKGLASAYEIGLTPDEKRLDIRHHPNLPFGWMQA